MSAMPARTQWIIHGHRYPFTVDEYHKMAEAGIFSAGDRVELLDGEILDMPPIGSNHAASVDRLNLVLTEAMNRRAIVRVQSPVRLDEYSEPQPDLTLLALRKDFYAPGHPRPKDVLLVVEVADASLQFDRRVKAMLYARARIPETWIIDLSAARIEVLRTPSVKGYRSKKYVMRGQKISPLAFPDISFSVDDIFG